MKRQELIEELQRELEKEGVIARDETQSLQVISGRIVDLILDKISESIKEGRTVSIRGFGTFKPKFYRGNTNSDIFTADSDIQDTDETIDRSKDTIFLRPTFKAGNSLRKALEELV